MSIKCCDCRFVAEDVIATGNGLYYFNYCQVDVTHLKVVEQGTERECDEFELLKPDGL